MKHEDMYETATLYAEECNRELSNLVECAEAKKVDIIRENILQAMRTQSIVLGEKEL